MYKIATLLIALTLPLSAQTEQKGEPPRLESLFSKYELASLNPEAIKRQVVDQEEPLILEVYGRQFVFEMEPRDMRSHRYLAEATGEDGRRQYIPPPPVHTFRGVTVGQDHVMGRFTITEDTFDGIIFTAGDWLYLEPVKNYLPESESGKTLIYADSDVTHTAEFQCGATSLHHGVEKMALPEQRAQEINRTTYYTAQIATEADYRYVQKIGSVTRANRLILSTLNKVEGVYEDELRLRFEVTYQHSWTTKEDPYYWESSARDLLNAFQGYWDENFFFQVDYDLAHMWTGSSALNGGIAWQGTVCNARSLGFGLSSHIDHHRGASIIAAHEIGHNFGASHPDEESPRVGRCARSIMESRFDVWTELTFCQFSRDQIRSHVSDYNFCLDDDMAEDPAITQAPSGLTVSPVSSTQIRLNWQNNGSDTRHIAIQRRIPGGRWAWRATLRRDSTTFLDHDLKPSTTYLYFVSSYLGDDLWTRPSNVATTVTEATDDDPADLCLPFSGEKDSQYEVVSFLTRYAGEKNSHYRYFLQVLLRNPTEHDLQYNVRVIFRDLEGFVVEKAVLWNRDVPTPDLLVPAGEDRLFADYMWARAYLDPKEVAAEVSIFVLDR